MIKNQKQYEKRKKQTNEQAKTHKQTNNKRRHTNKQTNKNDQINECRKCLSKIRKKKLVLSMYVRTSDTFRRNDRFSVRYPR